MGTPELLKNHSFLTPGTLGRVHILLPYAYFIEALIILTDGSDGDLIRSFLIPHSVHNYLFLTWHWGSDKVEARSDEEDSLNARAKKLMQH